MCTTSEITKLQKDIDCKNVQIAFLQDMISDSPEHCFNKMLMEHLVNSLSLNVELNYILISNLKTDANNSIYLNDNEIQNELKHKIKECQFLRNIINGVASDNTYQKIHSKHSNIIFNSLMLLKDVFLEYEENLQTKTK